MKIVIVSLTYLPAVGGLENIMSGLANQWANEHTITVFTNTADDSKDQTLPYKIVRRFTLFQLFKAVSAADVFIEANFSLNTCWVGLLNAKKWFVVHHLTYGTQGMLSFIKQQLTRFTHNISVSKFVANNIPAKSKIIPNFYSPVFKLYNEIERIKDIVFVGRLVSDKGADLLIEALHELKKLGKKYSLTIIGSGPELTKLMQLVEAYELNNQVVFEGVLTGELLAKNLNEHHVMVVPSRWKEPFGIVALEGLACGCKIVVPSEGGLKEAVDKLGFIFKHNNVESLAGVLEKAMGYKADDHLQLQEHLALHQQYFIAQQYIEFFKQKRSIG